MASIYSRFLLADGDVRSREAVENYLRSSGFPVEVAAGRHDCAAKLRNYQPDFFVVGLDAGDRGDGEWIIASVNNSPSASGRPIVLVLGNQPPRVLSQRTDVPSSYCFERPIHLEMLMNRICMAAVLAEAKSTF